MYEHVQYERSSEFDENWKSQNTLRHVILWLKCGTAIFQGREKEPLQMAPPVDLVVQWRQGDRAGEVPVTVGGTHLPSFAADTRQGQVFQAEWFGRFEGANQLVVCNPDDLECTVLLQKKG